MFTLEIDPGEMTADDVAEVLRRVADRITDGYPGQDIPASPGDSAPVRDVNGNTIGRWTWSA